jgi:hypothetical protein
MVVDPCELGQSSDRPNEKVPQGGVVVAGSLIAFDKTMPLKIRVPPVFKPGILYVVDPCHRDKHQCHRYDEKE